MKRLKTRILLSIIAFILIPAFVKTFARFHNFLLFTKKFKLPLLKPVAMTFMLAMAGMLFSAKSYGAVTISTMSVGAASTTPTYGTTTAVTYTITYTAANGASSNPYTISLNWTSTPAPTGVTITAVNGVNGATTFTPVNGTNRTFTITITTSGTGTTTNAGVYTFTVSAKPATGTTVTSSGTSPTLTVNKKALTITGLSGTNKVYDGTTTATPLTGTAALSGVVTGDVVTLGGTQTAVFASKNVANGIGITVSGYTIGGADAGNYTLTQPTGLTADITKKTLTVINLTGTNKVYDGTTTATFTGTATLSGIITGDAVTLGGTASAVFASKNVATGISITVSGYTLGGANAGNYSLTQPTLSANITVKTLTITASAVNKTYGTALTSGSVTTGFTPTGLATGDAIASLTMTYGTGAAATANVGTYTGSAVPSAATGTNFIAANYNITYVNGNIVCGTAALTITAKNQTKAYGNSFTFAGTEFTVTGLKNSDAVTSATISSTGAANTANAGTYTINISGAVGSGLSNYTITYNTGTMTVSTLSITITAAGPTIRYYGQPITTINGSTLFTVSGTLASGQSVTTVTLTGDANAQNYYQGAGNAYQVTPSNAAGSGGFVASNYNITYVAYSGTVSPAPITITATGPTSKVYGTALTTTTNSTTNFTESGTMAPFEQIDYVTLTPTGPGVAATAPVGSSFTITPSAALDYYTIFGFPIFPASTSNYTITYVGFTTGTITPAPLTITANAVSKAVGSTLTSGPGSTAFTSSGLVGTETIGSVTITYGAAAAAGAAVGVYTNQVTPSAATGGTFSPTNYTITYKSNTLTVVSGIYDWTGAVSTDWATPQNWNINGVQQTTTYPGLNVATDVVQVGVVAYTSGNQPTLAANTPFAIASVNFGPATTPSTLNLNASVALSITGNLTLNTGAEVVNLNGASGSSLNIGTDYVTNTGSTFNNNSAAAITISGLFTNGGTSNFGTTLVTFTNPSNTAVFNTATSQLFTNVLFTGGGHITLNHSIAAGQFSIASTGVITLGNNETLTVGSAPLTLLSDVNGSATVAALPSGASITGNVSVQRYLQAVRAYRLVSSPVYASTVTGNNVYSINYLKGSAPLTGTDGIPGGLDKAGNPTLYLYRENLAPLYSSFLNSNFRGINNISASPTYGMDDTTYASVNIPVGNGYLFYFRGSLHQASLATLTKAGATATNDTLSTTGTLNQGTITVANWYTPGSTNLGFTTLSDTTSVEGSNLVGNPYASSIDWDQSDSTNTAAPIYAPHVAPFTYQLILTGQGAGNYNVYQAGNGGVGTVNTVNSNIIPSGEGFFVFATGTGAALTFTEAAKTNAQVTGSNLYLAKRLALSTNIEQSLRFQLSMDTLTSDGTIIHFNANASANFNRSEDATYRLGTGKVSLSSLSADRRSLAINQLPFVVKGQRIPLNVTATTDGTYSLSMTRITGISQLFNVWLKDNYLKDSVNMRLTSSYSFSVLHSDTGTFGPNRFVVLITQNPSYTYQLLSFGASKMSAAREVKVAWKTENEDNYTRFMVERSVDNGKTFEELGTLNSDAVGAYYFMDQKPIIGQNLYRLKQVDINNNLTYSNVVQISYSDLGNNLAQNNISIFPNPTTSNINLAVLTDMGANLTYNIKITNSTGLVIKQATTNQPSMQLNVSGWLPGTYLVRVFNNKDQSEVGTTKFIKL